MEKITVTESGTDCSHISYLYHALMGEGGMLTPSVRLSLSRGRICLAVEADKEERDKIHGAVVSAVGDIIAISYKYTFLKRYIDVKRLSDLEREVLLAALISADFTEDKKYVVKRISSLENFSVDGIFNFRIPALIDKWTDVISYIPESFTYGELEKFIAFLLEGDGGKIYVKDNEVFDEKYRKLRRSRLIGSFPEFSFLREIILSCADKIFLLTVPGAEECKFLKKYYGNHVFFG